MKSLKWLRVGAAVVETVLSLRALFANIQAGTPEMVNNEIGGALKAVEEAAGVDIPEELVKQVIEVALPVVQIYFAQHAKI